MSVNLHKFQVTHRGPGKVGVKGNNFGYGETFVLPADQVELVIPHIRAGKLQHIGEIDDSETGGFSSNAASYRLGKSDAVKRNYLPLVTLDIQLADTAFDTASRMPLAYLRPRRSLALTKVVLKATTLPAVDDGSGVLNLDNKVHMLLTKGNPGEYLEQITTFGYIDEYDVVTSIGLPDTTTTLDLFVGNADEDNALYLGSPTRKFAGVYVDMTASVNSTTSSLTIRYWNGSAWTDFDNVDDLTTAGGITLAQSGWIAWYEKPGDWELTKLSGTAEAYWIQIVSSANFDADVEIERIVIPDEEPLVGIEAIGYGGDFDAVVSSDNATLADITSALADGGAGVSNIVTQWTTSDYVYIGHSSIYGGIVVDVGTTPNAAAETITLSYWNGFEWVDASATDGTASGGAMLAIDGAITFAIPADWRRVAASSTLLGATPPTTISTEDLYWTRVEVSGTLTAGVDLDQLGVVYSATIPREYFVPINQTIEASDYLNLHVGETEAETDALATVELQLIGLDI